jgi:phosphoribosylaminoimidazolecarboxamide formyltransferase/IMP cyclohydrolase
MAQDLKAMYRTQTLGDFPATVEILGKKYEKVEDLRYGTNPHQPAAFYRPAGGRLVLGGYKMLKTGKAGLSQTNIEDMHHAVGILKYLQRPACAVMKHCNPSGVAMQVGSHDLKTVYERARDADAQAAFGSVVAFNREVDAATADAIMQTVVEGIAAPGFTPEALENLNAGDKYKRNKEIRVIQLPDFSVLPKYLDDGTDVREIKVFDDGSIVLAVPYLSRVKMTADLVPAYAEGKQGRIEIARKPDARELDDLLFAWYVNEHPRAVERRGGGEERADAGGGYRRAGPRGRGGTGNPQGAEEVQGHGDDAGRRDVQRRVLSVQGRRARGDGPRRDGDCAAGWERERLRRGGGVQRIEDGDGI